MSFIDNYYLDLLEAERTIDRLRQERDNLKSAMEWWRTQYVWLVNQCVKEEGEGG